jgi:hypothetical protein
MTGKRSHVKVIRSKAKNADNQYSDDYFKTKSQIYIGISQEISPESFSKRKMRFHTALTDFMKR